MNSPEKVYAANLPQLHQIDAGDFKVHANWEHFKANFKAENGQIEVMRALFTDPMIDHSARMERSDGRWKAESTAQPGSGVAMPKVDDYYAAYREQIAPYGLTTSNSLFTNHKIVLSENRLLGMVSLQSNGLITYNVGEYGFTSERWKGISQHLVAPRLDEIKEGHALYFKHVMQMQLLATAALAECISGRKLRNKHDFLLTDFATYIFDEEKGVGERQRERLSLQMPPARETVIATESTALNDNAKQGDIFTAEFAANEHKVMIDDVIGSAEMHRQLRNVVKAFKHPEAMKRWGVSMSQGVLLHGAPGTGKTMAAQALANELGGELWEVQVNDIKGKWLGESEKNIQALFDEAKKKSIPTVMMWDEIDAIIGRATEQGNGGSETMDAVRGVFKREAARLAERAPNVILVGATNHIDRIDEAILRAGRFDTKIYMGLPNDDDRVQLLSSKIASMVAQFGSDDHLVYSPDINMQRLAVLTNEWSGAELNEILIRAQRRKAFEEAEGKQPGPITQQDLEYEIRLFRQG